MDATECKEAFERRKATRDLLGMETLDGLELVYRVFIRSEQDTKTGDELMDALLVDGPLKTSGKRLNAIMKAAITPNRKYASSLCSIVRFALRENIPPNELRDFISAHGGIAKTVKEYLALKLPNSETQVGRTSSIKVDVSGAKVLGVMARILKSVAASKKSKTRRAKLQFSIGGKVEVIEILPPSRSSRG